MTAHADLERLEELSVADALGELTDAERAEYEALRKQYPDFDTSLTDRAVGATLAAIHSSGEPLPDGLRSTIVNEGERLLARQAHANPSESSPPPAGLKGAPSARRAARPSVAWWSLAAVVLLTVAIWMALPQQPTPSSPVQQREALLASGRNLVQASWSAGGDPAGEGIQGDVVWDPQTQTGYMRFVGLRPNSPTLEQYQLWIFDSMRDERYPVDGGVFDVSASGEVIVPIKASLRVEDVVLFAVTVERPGGVVVSSRERIAALAKIS